MALTREDRIRGGHASQRVLATKRAEMSRRAEIAYRLVSEVEDVAPATLDAVLMLVTAARDADVTIESSLDLLRTAQTAEILHRISRLANGQSTANVAHATMTDEERRERMAQLRAIQHDTATPPTPNTK